MFVHFSRVIPLLLFSLAINFAYFKALVILLFSVIFLHERKLFTIGFHTPNNKHPPFLGLGTEGSQLGVVQKEMLPDYLNSLKREHECLFQVNKNYTQVTVK